MNVFAIEPDLTANSRKHTNHTINSVAATETPPDHDRRHTQRGAPRRSGGPCVTVVAMPYPLERPTARSREHDMRESACLWLTFCLGASACQVGTSPRAAPVAVRRVDGGAASLLTPTGSEDWVRLSIGMCRCSN